MQTLQPLLFTPLETRGITLRNRIAVSPMCQYSSVDGFATDWHLVHLGSRAVGGAGLVMAEATAVTPEGRISPNDLGIWDDRHIERLTTITAFIRSQGAVPAIQLAHAGRKASTRTPWTGRGSLAPEDGGWQPLAPSPLPFDDGSLSPRELERSELDGLAAAFAAAAARSLQAGFDVVEIHAAHGYLLHEFLSPATNNRHDEFGGTFDNRIRLLTDVVKAVRRVWPDRLPLWVRISGTDWLEQGGWDIEESVELARRLKGLGVDLIDTSSGGIVPGASVPIAPGYQVPLASRIKSEAEIATGAVGLITQPEQAESILQNGEADVVLLARELLRDPYWPRRAAEALGAPMPYWPNQYRSVSPPSS